MQFGIVYNTYIVDLNLVYESQIQSDSYCIAYCYISKRLRALAFGFCKENASQLNCLGAGPLDQVKSKK